MDLNQRMKILVQRDDLDTITQVCLLLGVEAYDVLRDIYRNTYKSLADIDNLGHEVQQTEWSDKQDVLSMLASRSMRLSTLLKTTHTMLRELGEPEQPERQHTLAAIREDVFKEYERQQTIADNDNMPQYLRDMNGIQP